MSPGTLHFFCGRIASGKTTAARALATELHAVMVCEDEWLAGLFDGAQTFEQYLERRKRIRSILEVQMPQVLAAGASVVFDFAGNTRRDRAWAKSLADAAGAPHALHVLSADEVTCRERLRVRNESQPPGIYWGPVSEQLFDQVNAYFQAPQPDEELTIALAR
jgi:predicted kinase